MITSQTINIMALNDDRRRIHEHIGRFTVQAAAIDQRLAELLNALDPSQVAQPGKYLSWRRKIELISVQPRVASWAQWPALEKSLAEIADYRNQLDHSVLVSRISMETGLVVHSGIRESQGFIPEPFDLAQLAQAEDQANVVFLGLYALVRGHIGDFESFTMRTLAVGMLTDDSLLNALNHVYPEASDVRIQCRRLMAAAGRSCRKVRQHDSQAWEQAQPDCISALRIAARSRTSTRPHRRLPHMYGLDFGRNRASVPVP